jgi:hypothetical protein
MSEAGQGLQGKATPTEKYDVFEPDGTYLFQVELPGNTFVAVARGTNIWCIARDESGVERIKRYRLVMN